MCLEKLNVFNKLFNCKLQLRLDFLTFTLAGPSTAVESMNKVTNGNFVGAGLEANQARQGCQNDRFWDLY